jgi:hypothetical protein
VSSWHAMFVNTPPRSLSVLAGTQRHERHVACGVLLGSLPVEVGMEKRTSTHPK